MLNNTLIVNTVNIIPQNYPLGFGRRLKSDYVNAPQICENLGFLAFFESLAPLASLVYLPKRQQFEVFVFELS